MWPEKVVALALKHIESNTKAILWPRVNWRPVHNRTMIVLGGGPSLNDCLEEIRDWSDAPFADLFAVADVLDWCTDKGITPHGHVIVDMFTDIERTLSRPPKAVVYYVASQCQPAVFMRLIGGRGFLFHLATEFDSPLEPGAAWIGGGTTAATRMVHLGYVLGYRNFIFYGVDSCYRDTTHAYGHPRAPVYLKRARLVTDGKREFLTTDGLLGQAQEFVWLKGLFKNCKIQLRGDGLAPYMTETTWLT